MRNKIDALKYEAVFIRNPLKVKSDNWQETSHEWRITINEQSFSFFTCLGHRESKYKMNKKRHAILSYDGNIYIPDALSQYKRLKNANLTQEGMEKFFKVSVAVIPEVKDVLYSLVMDASAENETFADWCANSGYDEDSRKAMNIYLACQENATKLHQLKLGTHNELQEFFQDY